MRSALTVGAILVWIGTVMLLRRDGPLSHFDFWGLVFLGTGIILLVGGAAARASTGGGGGGSLTAGVIVALIGLLLLTGFADLGPLFLIALGLLIIVTTISGGRRFRWFRWTRHSEPAARRS